MNWRLQEVQVYIYGWKISLTIIDVSSEESLQDSEVTQELKTKNFLIGQIKVYRLQRIKRKLKMKKELWVHLQLREQLISRLLLKYMVSAES